jgi:hypothetical protein
MRRLPTVIAATLLISLSAAQELPADSDDAPQKPAAAWWGNQLPDLV